MKVKDIMKKNLVSVSSSSGVSEAAKKMLSENVGTVLVIDNDRLKGIVTDRQIVAKVIAAGKDPGKVKVSDFMTRDPITGSPGMEVCDVAEIIGEKGYRRVPILEHEKPVGILSSADLVDHAGTCSRCMKNLLSEIGKAQR